MDHWQPYEVPQSLWSVIELYAPTVELPEIKCIIGDDVIEQSNELFEEIYNLIEIWRCVVDNCSRAAPIKKANTLPEPPLIREQFVQRIRSFIDNLDATKNHMLLPFLEERKAISTYAVSPQARPTSRGSDGRITPSRRPSSRSSGDISLYRDNISAFEIETVVSDIQAAFNAEQSMLHEDIEFLQRSIDEEHLNGIGEVRDPPSLHELKTFAEDLEKKVFDLDKPVFAEIGAHSGSKPSSPMLTRLPTTPSRLPPSTLQSLPSRADKPVLSNTPILKSGVPSVQRPKPPPLNPVLQPTIPTQNKSSWRQRTLKKVSQKVSTESSGRMFLRDIELRGDSPQGSNYTPGPPPQAKLQPTPPSAKAVPLEEKGLTGLAGVRRQRLSNLNVKE